MTSLLPKDKLHYLSLTLDTTGLNLKVFTQLLKHAPRKERWSGPKTHRHHKPFAGIDDSIVVENLVEYDAVGLVVLEEAAQYAKRQHEHAKQATRLGAGASSTQLSTVPSYSISKTIEAKQKTMRTSMKKPWT